MQEAAPPSTGSIGCPGHRAGRLASREVRLPASKGKQVLQTRWVELERHTSQASHILARLGERSFLQNRILARQVGKTKNKMATGRDSARGRWRVHTSPREGRLNGNGQHQPRIKRVSCPVTITSSTKGAAKKIKNPQSRWRRRRKKQQLARFPCPLVGSRLRETGDEMDGEQEQRKAMGY